MGTASWQAKILLCTVYSVRLDEVSKIITKLTARFMLVSFSRPDLSTVQLGILRFLHHAL